MAEEVITVQIEGLDDLKRNFASIPHKLRRNALRVALAHAAVPVRDLAKENRAQAPRVSNVAEYLTAAYRHGAVEAAIKIRTSKVATAAGDVGVFVNVKPAAKGAAGRDNPNDPFYWRFLEFGTRYMAAKPFLVPAANALGQSLEIFTREMIDVFARMDADPNDPL